MSNGRLRTWIVLCFSMALLAGAWATAALAGIAVIAQRQDEGAVTEGKPAAPPGPPACQQVLAQTSEILALLSGGPAETRKKYFLSTEQTGGNVPASFCGDGFHMASLWEIFNTAVLKYDTTQGHTRLDSGQGPPTTTFGWIRTGDGSIASNILPGNTNCAAYTSSLNTDRGTAVELPSNWDTVATTSKIAPWEAADLPCNTPVHVWCVQD